MTLKNVIVYFIILNLTVVIAQETTLLPSSTISGKAPSSTSTLTPPSGENNSENCLGGNVCKSANETLGLCNGAIKPPTKYIEEGVRNGTYRPDDPGLSKCMCNQPYYDTLSACIECFVNTTGTEFQVEPLQQYKDECKKLGTTFTQTMPPPQPKGIPRKLRLGLTVGIVTVVIGLIGISLLKYYRRKRRIAEQSAFAKRISTEMHSGSRLSTGDSLTTTYPPPKSPSTHYPPPTSTDTYQPYAPPTDYPPPSNISNIPTPQSTTPYYPPPGGEYPPPQPPPPRGGQGGQSDSYYDGNF